MLGIPKKYGKKSNFLRYRLCKLAIKICSLQVGTGRVWSMVIVAFWHCGALGCAPSRLRRGWAWSMFSRIFALRTCISFHFGLVGVQISLHFGLVGFHFLAFWPRGLSFPCILAPLWQASGAPPTSCQKRTVFL